MNLAIKSRSLPCHADLVDAAQRVAGTAIHTPLLESDALNAQIGGRLLIKAECLQRTGSFKFRGAYNRISRLTEAEKRAGVVAYSSGNHAQGVAAAARLVGCPALILMPDDAPEAKVAGVEFWGGEIVRFNRASDDREAMGEAIRAERGAVLVPPYEDPHIIAGQGTAGLEAMEQLAEKGLSPDLVMCCAGGGGLIAGVGLAVRHAAPEARIYAAEPEGFDDHRRSVISGQRETNDRLTGSICDAIITPTPGELTWALNKDQLAGGIAVSDEAVLKAIGLAWRHLKIVIEPGGAAALAAALFGDEDVSGKTTLVFATGGNIDRAMFQRALETL